MKKNYENLVRIFLAIDIDEPLRKKLVEIIEVLKIQAPDKVKWSTPENLHLTLHFLGEVEPEKISSLDKLIPDAIKSIKAFDLELGRIIHFPPTHRPRIIALSFPLTEELAELFKSLEKIVRQCSFTLEERPFLPHLTLGRLRAPHELNLSQITTQLPHKIAVKEIILYRSDPGEHGSIYTPIKKYKLGFFQNLD